MKNFPKHINTRADLDNCAEYYPAETKAFLADILTFKDVWISVTKLADGEAGVTDDTHKVVEDKDMNGVVAGRYQYELMEDPSANSPIKRFGFSNGAELQAYMDAV